MLKLKQTSKHRRALRLMKQSENDSTCSEAGLLNDIFDLSAYSNEPVLDGRP